MREPIQTDRLVLVPVSREVAAAIVAGDLSGVAPGAGWPHADTLDGLRLAVDHGTDLGWFVTLDGLVMGDCGTHGAPDAAGTVEIGYGLAGPYRGRGLATEMCRALTGWLLSQPDVRRVVASTHAAANPASRRVLEKSGFTFDRDDGALAWYVRCSTES
jgi:RimJ/RimL family protein N-acetyltransferase